MASREVKSFLSSVDAAYLEYAEALHVAGYSTQAELGAATRPLLVALGIRKGAAGLIIASATGVGVHAGGSFLALLIHYQPLGVCSALQHYVG